MRTMVLIGGNFVPPPADTFVARLLEAFDEPRAEVHELIGAEDQVLVSATGRIGPLASPSTRR